MNKRKKIVGIAKDTLDFILEVSKSNHPREFIGMLCADADVITDVFFLPGTVSSGENAIIRLDMMPMGLDYVGSVHSHPHPAAMHPSEQDLLMFSKTGNCHIITFYPYARESWRCYNSKGEEKNLEIVETDL
ncbi:metal-dependent protease of the PAD1/JAB1 superfamily [Methanophagales archaeon]|nr:MAG: metal-dependent protease of the PAD1/JAB1 superfamily [Methanophagales archaeon]